MLRIAHGVAARRISGYGLRLQTRPAGTALTKPFDAAEIPRVVTLVSGHRSERFGPRHSCVRDDTRSLVTRCFKHSRKRSPPLIPKPMPRLCSPTLATFERCPMTRISYVTTARTHYNTVLRLAKSAWLSAEDGEALNVKLAEHQNETRSSWRAVLKIDLVRSTMPSEHWTTAQIHSLLRQVVIEHRRLPQLHVPGKSMAAINNQRRRLKEQAPSRRLFRSQTRALDHLRIAAARKADVRIWLQRGLHCAAATHPRAQPVRH